MKDAALQALADQAKYRAEVVAHHDRVADYTKSLR